MLAYLSRYSHPVAIASSRLISCTDKGAAFKWKDYRSKGQTRHKVMNLATQEFIRRFLIHVLPQGFHHIRHYALLRQRVRRTPQPARGPPVDYRDNPQYRAWRRKVD